MPRVPGNYPAPWWGADQDRDLLIGVCKHGYQQYVFVFYLTDLLYSFFILSPFRYPRIWRDSELSFSKIIPQVAEEETGGDNGDKDSDQGDNDEMEVDGADDAVEDNQADNSATTESQKPAALTNILNGSDQPTVWSSYVIVARLAYPPLCLEPNYTTIICSSSSRSISYSSSCGFGSSDLSYTYSNGTWSSNSENYQCAYSIQYEATDSGQLSFAGKRARDDGAKEDDEGENSS